MKKLDQKTLGLKSDREFRNAAACLAFEARVSGLKQVDHVVLTENGTGLFAVQGRMDDPAHRVHVDKTAASSQAIEKSTVQMDQEGLTRLQHQERQQSIDREPRYTMSV